MSKFTRDLWEHIKTMIAYAVLVALLSILVFGGRIVIEINFTTATQLLNRFK